MADPLIELLGWVFGKSFEAWLDGQGESRQRTILIWSTSVFIVIGTAAVVYIFVFAE